MTATTTRRHRAWRPATYRGTPASILRTHRALADAVGINAYAKKLKIKPGTMSRYLAGDYMPRDNATRRALGLPTRRLVTVNPVSRWADMSVGELRRALVDRREYP